MGEGGIGLDTLEMYYDSIKKQGDYPRTGYLLVFITVEITVIDYSHNNDY